jgi:protein phosphatase
MSPSETSEQHGLLEHPAEAIAYYRKHGVEKVVCEEKHMGSRAVVIVCRSPDVALKRFGISSGEFGVCYTRTGRRFFNDLAMESAFLERVREAIDAANFWEEFKTDWICLDCELMPWSLKALELVRDQYAAVGAAGTSALHEVEQALRAATARGVDVATLATKIADKRDQVTRYVAAYRRYCWPVNSLDDVRLAPFHLLATEGVAHTDKDHTWHMETLARLANCTKGFIIATPYKVITVNDTSQVAEGIGWWEALTDRGGEGMVVKPLEFAARGKRGLLQPAIKSRGREYLRIIYGPEYTSTANLERLRERGLSGKRSLALREFALGIEALERFVRREPLRRVHECVFGVLALESEPIDPRL